MALRIVPQKGGLVISVKVVPGASRDRIVGELGDALKIAVSKPPQGGAANAAVLELLADALNLRPRDLKILSGHANPHKQVMIADLSAEQVLQRLKC